MKSKTIESEWPEVVGDTGTEGAHITLFVAFLLVVGIALVAKGCM